MEESQDASDSSGDEWRRRKKKVVPKSSVSQRTRSKLGENRKNEISQFLEDGNTTINSTMVEDGSLMETFTIDEEEDTWQGESDWKKTVKKLKDTVERASVVIGKGNKGLQIVNDLKKKITEYEIINIESEDSEKTEKKKVKFEIEHGTCNQVLEEVMNSLDMIIGMNIENAPKAQIESSESWQLCVLTYIVK